MEGDRDQLFIVCPQCGELVYLREICSVCGATIPLPLEIEGVNVREWIKRNTEKE